MHVMKSITIYSKDVFYNRFSVWKKSIRGAYFSKFLDKEILLDMQFCLFIDLLKNSSDANAGHYKSKDDYIEFLATVLDNDENILVEDLTDYEKKHFIPKHDNLIRSTKNAKFYDKPIDKIINSKRFDYYAYTFSRVYDIKTGTELPAYYILLAFCIPLEELSDSSILLKGSVQEYKNDLFSLEFNNEITRTKQIYQADNILKYDFAYDRFIQNLKNYIVEFINEDALDNSIYKNFEMQLLEIGDYGLREYCRSLLNSFISDIEQKQLATKCPHCGKMFKYKKGKKFCSEECQLRAKSHRKYIKKRDAN